jgi:hypothetical protein
MRVPFEALLRSLRPTEGSKFKIEESSHAQTRGIDLAWVQVPATTDRQQSYPFSIANFDIEERKILSLHRWKIWWLIPRLLQCAGEASPETYLMLCKLKNKEEEQASDSKGGHDQYIIILASTDKAAYFSLEGGKERDQLVVHGHFKHHRGTLPTEELHNAILIGRGSSPLELIETSVLHLKKYLRESFPEVEAPTAGLPSTPAPSKQSFVDWFGWCTWDSFYTDLSAQKVLSGLKSFERHTAVRPRFLILDDGWQRTDVDHQNNGGQWGGRLASFHANFKFSKDYDAADSAEVEVAVEEEIIPSARPHMHASGSTLIGDNYSLQALIAECKSNYIDSFFVWHTLTGYWAGVSVQEGNHQVQDYHPKLVYPFISASAHRMSVADALHTEPFTQDGVGLVDAQHAASFFSDYHTNLAAMGVDGVKVDAQSVLPLLDDERADGENIPLAFHKALQRSVRGAFPQTKSGATDVSPLIHCMAHSQGTLLSIAALYGSSREIAVIRGSDDFWPAEEASHGPHLYANAMNSLLISNLGLHDWDMFQSGLGKPSAMHAASRAISGGPVYVSDKPSSHDAAILRQISMPDGSIPRPCRNARPPISGLFLDPQRRVGEPLLLQNTNPCGGLVVGVFNIVGAVLENDLDMFRSLEADQMFWPEGRDKPAPDQFDKSTWSLGIEWDVTPRDVEEYDEAAQYVSYRWSDGQIRLEPHVVNVSLPEPFVFDIVSFAPVHHISNEVWIACVGALEMINIGGTVLDFEVHNHAIHVSLLGEGRFVLVCSIRASVAVESVSVLGGGKDVTLQDVSLSFRKAEEDASFTTIELEVRPQGQMQGEGKGRQTTLAVLTVTAEIL